MIINFYKITNLINRKIYIGQTSLPIIERLQQHFKIAAAGDKKHLYRAVRKYGTTNFIIELIDQCDISLLTEKERYWIKFFNSRDPKIGYNIHEGGRGGRQTPEVYKLIGKKVSIANKGRPCTKQTKQKISAARRGWKMSEAQKLHLSQVHKASGHKPPNWNKGLHGFGTPFFGKRHTDETKRKIGAARAGKTWEDVFGAQKASKLRESHRQRFIQNNPQFKDIKKDDIIVAVQNNKDLGVVAIAKKLDITFPTLIIKIKKFFNCTPTELKEKICSGD